MRKISAANSVASSPPVPARISSTTFLSSLRILGQQQNLELFLDAAPLAAPVRAISSSAMARRSGSASCSMGRACERLSSTFFHSRYLATISDSSLCALVTLRYWSASLMTAGSAICWVSSSKRFSS